MNQIQRQEEEEKEKQEQKEDLKPDQNNDPNTGHALPPTADEITTFLSLNFTNRCLEYTIKISPKKTGWIIKSVIATSEAFFPDTNGMHVEYPMDSV
jgi:hypothetical protein